jgi:hypothetical protein
MESSFVRWNSLQAATPWFRKRDLQGNKTEERDQMDTRGHELNVVRIPTA